jgi:hypothetical protein
MRDMADLVSMPKASSDPGIGSKDGFLVRGYR